MMDDFDSDDENAWTLWQAILLLAGSWIWTYVIYLWLMEAASP